MAPNVTSVGDERVRAVALDRQAELAVLAALGDPENRTILRVTGESPRTAAELRVETTIPNSTLYRKLERLVDLSLLESQVRAAGVGPHPTEYRRTFDAVYIDLSEDDDRGFLRLLSHGADR